MPRVLIVDDSEVLRGTIRRELTRDPAIEIVGEAGDPFAARDLILQLNPDVVTLDIEMPRMDGISFLARIMKYRPLPVIIVSALAEHGSEFAIQAMANGAVDIVVKPGVGHPLPEFSLQLREKVKSAAGAKFAAHAAPGIGPIRAAGASGSKFVFVGASTGGVQAIESLLRGFPEDCPATAIVQHMPAGFTASFAKRLDSLLPIEVREAAHGDDLKRGVVLIAPGSHHLVVKRAGTRAYVELSDAPPVNKHRPSVEVLFRSVAGAFRGDAIGVMLTGMGADGADGLLRMKEAGAYTIAQDEASCAVFGMPRAAIERGAVAVVAPLSEISSLLLNDVRTAPAPR